MQCASCMQHHAHLDCLSKEACRRVSELHQVVREQLHVSHVQHVPEAGTQHEGVGRRQAVSPATSRSSWRPASQRIRRHCGQPQNHELPDREQSGCAPGLEVCSEVGAIRRPQEGCLDVAGQHVLKVLVSEHYLLRGCRPGQRVSQVLASGSQRHAQQRQEVSLRARLSDSRRSSAAKKKRPIESPATTNQRCASSVRRSSASCRLAPHRSAWADHCQLSLGPGPHVARLGAAAQLCPQDRVSVLRQGCPGVCESERYVQPHLSGGLLVQLPELYSASQLLP